MRSNISYFLEIVLHLLVFKDSGLDFESDFEIRFIGCHKSISDRRYLEIRIMVRWSFLTFISANNRSGVRRLVRG